MPNQSNRELLRSLPSIEELLNDPRLKALEGRIARRALVQAAREAVDDVRTAVLEGARQTVERDDIATDALLRATASQRPSLRRVINASGVVIHTNLGRSVMARSAVEAAADAAGRYSTLEYDTAAMARGSRHAHCEKLICALTGAEAAIAVNNNAAAVMMVLSEFASGHRAVVSRGELVEIGGSFRIPDIMALSGADMVEIGTTNKTHARDYVRAIDDDTAMLLKVHPSNYRLIGFTENVAIDELRDIADETLADRAARDVRGELLVYEDQGSGAFAALPFFGSYGEPTVAESLKQGADLVSFSGDKLLGGPQAGIIVGSKRHIDRLKANPLARVLRLDKMTIAALEATLRLYLDEERARREVPTLRMLSETADDLRPRAERLAAALRGALDPQDAAVDVVDEVSRAGGGALPMCDIPTCVVRVAFVRGDVQECERRLICERDVPVIGRIKKDALLLDARTILDEGEEAEIVHALAEYFERPKA